MSMEANIGRSLISARSRRGLSQKAVARRAGVDASYLSRIESGKVQPTVRTVWKIAGALGVSASSLLDPSPPRAGEGVCPVSPSGHCMVELIQTHAAPGGSKTDSFSPLQLRVIRGFAGIVQQGRPELLKALDRLFAELMVGVCFLEPPKT